MYKIIYLCTLKEIYTLRHGIQYERPAVNSKTPQNSKVPKKKYTNVCSIPGESIFRQDRFRFKTRTCHA